MVEVTDNAVALNQMIWDELVGHRDSARAAMNMRDATDATIELNHDAYTYYTGQLNLMDRVCCNLGININKEVK